MYHRPRMCRTCLQMSRGDFKFVSLDSVDTLWESNSPNLKDQLIYLVPEMKIDSTGSYICTSCFIALRTAYEFKMMCQATEKKFQDHNYKYRRPYGVGPGSSQFHVTLNENCNYQEIANFRCQNLNYLQADTSIDITEHHLYDATKVPPRNKQLNILNNVTQKLPEIDVEVIVGEKNAEKQKTNTDKTENNIVETNTATNKEEQKENVPEDNTDKQPKEGAKKLDSVQLRRKYNIGSQISILKTKRKTVASTQAIIRMACHDIPYLKLNNIGPDALRCHVRIQQLTQEFVNTNPCGKYTLDELKEIAQSYYLEDFNDLLTCKFCNRCFSTKYWLEIHEQEQHTSEKPFSCTHCNMQFVRSDSLEEHAKIHNKLLLVTPSTSDGAKPQIVKPPDPRAVKPTTDGVKEENPENVTKNTDVTPTANACSNQGKAAVEPNSTETVTKKVKLESSNETKTDDPTSLSKRVSDAAIKPDIKNANSNGDVKISNGTKSSSAAKVVHQTTEAELKQAEISQKLKKKRHLEVVRYCKCLICNKICRGEVQLYQHCKFVHVPNGSSSNYWSNVIYVSRMKQETSENFDNGAIEDENNEMEDDNDGFEDANNEMEDENDEMEDETKEDNLLIETRRVVYRNSLTPYKCNICDKAFPEENFLNLHMYVHTPTILSPENVFNSNYESPEVYTCYLCNKGFAKERYLKLHNLHVHLTKTTVCKFCNREFKSDFWFGRHKCQQLVEAAPVPEEDDDNKTFQCNFCNRKFARLRFMKSHRKRMHKNMIRSPMKIKPKYLANRNTKEPLEIGNLELDVDPMKLYTIAGTSSFEDDEDVIEILSDSDYTDGTSNESEEDEEEEEEEERPTIYVHSKIQNQPPASMESRRTLTVFSTNTMTNRQVPTEREEITFNNSSEITIRRRSIVRSTPKLQCDFCGEFIDESAYDNHIFEHNTMRLQKSLNIRKSEHNYSFDPLQENLDNEKIVLQCHICFKYFKRKFLLISHINRHLNGEDSQQAHNSSTGHLSEGEEIENYHSENETPPKETEIDETQYGQVTIVNGVEIYECCGRAFKLKAHFFRHFKIKHPHSICKPRIIERKENHDEHVAENKTEEENDEESEETVSNRTRYNTRKSVSNQGNTSINEAAKNAPEQNTDTQGEEVNKDDIDSSIINKKTSKINVPLTSNTTKRKLPNQLVNEEALNKRLKMMKRELSDTEEVLTRKRIKTEAEVMVTTPVNFNDIELLPLGDRSPGKYECSVCDKRFKQKCQLRDHFNVHTGDKPYKCEFCIPVRGFTQTSSLYVHFRRVHAVIMKNCLWEVYSKNGSCLACNEVFEKHAIMFRHMKDYYAEKQFQCHVCMKNCHMLCHYRLHNIDPEEMQMILPQDNLEVIMTEDTEEDKEESSGETKSLHDGTKRSDTPASLLTEGTCDSDAATSSNDDKLSEMEDNKSLNPEQLECVKCDKTFTDKQQLRFHKKSLAHIQQVQSIKKQFNPENEDTADTNMETPDTVDTIEDLQNNVNAIMKKIRTIKRHHCPMCDMSFIRKVQLKKHKKKCHRKRVTNIKQNCAKIISDAKQESVIDSPIPDGELEMEDENDEIENETKEDSLLIETRRVNNKNVLTPYKCNICDKAFREENFLNLHMYVHIPVILPPENVFNSNYENLEVYTCYLCNKGFGKERFLKLHNLQVHLIKTSVCKICSREFKSDFWFGRHKCQLPVEVPVPEDTASDKVQDLENAPTSSEQPQQNIPCEENIKESNQNSPQLEHEVADTHENAEMSEITADLNKPIGAESNPNEESLEVRCTSPTAQINQNSPKTEHDTNIETPEIVSDLNKPEVSTDADPNEESLEMRCTSPSVQVSQNSPKSEHEVVGAHGNASDSNKPLSTESDPNEESFEMRCASPSVQINQNSPKPEHEVVGTDENVESDLNKPEVGIKSDPNEESLEMRCASPSVQVNQNSPKPEHEVVGTDENVDSDLNKPEVGIESDPNEESLEMRCASPSVQLNQNSPKPEDSPVSTETDPNEESLEKRCASPSVQINQNSPKYEADGTHGNVEMAEITCDLNKPKLSTKSDPNEESLEMRCASPTVQVNRNSPKPEHEVAGTHGPVSTEADPNEKSLEMRCASPSVQINQNSPEHESDGTHGNAEMAEITCDLNKPEVSTKSDPNEEHFEIRCASPTAQVNRNSPKPEHEVAGTHGPVSTEADPNEESLEMRYESPSVQINQNSPEREVDDTHENAEIANLNKPMVTNEESLEMRCASPSVQINRNSPKPEVADFDEDVEMPEITSELNKPEVSPKSNSNEESLEMGCTFPSTDDTAECPNSIFESDEPCLDEKSLDSNNENFEFELQETEQNSDIHFDETSKMEIDDTSDFPTLEVPCSKESQEVKQNVSGDYDLDCPMGNVSTEEDSSEKEPSAMYSTDFNLDCVPVEKLNTAGTSCLKTTGLNNESVDTQPKAMFSDQNLECTKSISNAELTISSTDCDMEYPKSITDNACLEVNSVNTINNFDLESLKTISDAYECVELDK